ncbi:unnamed protein product [Effrenium voratum]|uniref:Uncharacterized protein n=1 Tax=Effrenium voratum TaxID=2562239 RepID=A0AA36N370_9DINO|nr:unnamed protein product [Effrenium voratum]
MERQQIVAFGLTLAAGYAGYLHRLGVTLPQERLRAVMRGPRIARDVQKVLARIHEKRQDLWLACASTCAFTSELYCLCVLLMQLIAHGYPKDMFLKCHFWSSLVSAMIMRWASRPNATPSSRETFLVTFGINLMALLNCIDVPIHLLSANYLGRVFLASFAPDMWMTFWIDVAMMPAFIAAGCARLHSIGQFDSGSLGLVIFNEFVCVGFTLIVLLQVSSLTVRQEVATMELEELLAKQEAQISETEGILNAARRLLSVTCDCCEQLSHDWRILQPSQRWLEIIRYPHKDKPMVLSLADFISTQDLDRFKQFIETETDVPSLLHLRMKDFAGSSFDAQLFQVRVPSLLTAQPQHLVGITTQEVREPLSRPGRREIPSIPEGGILDEDDSRSSDRSSTHSSNRMPAAAADMHRTQMGTFLQHIEVVDSMRLIVDLHTGTSGYDLCGLGMTFKSRSKEDKDSSKGPKFYDLLRRRHRVTVEDWLQEHLNSWYYGEDCEERCLGVKLGVGESSVLVGDMGVLNIWETQEEQLYMELEMRNFVAPQKNGNAARADEN